MVHGPLLNGWQHYVTFWLPKVRQSNILFLKIMRSEKASTSMFLDQFSHTNVRNQDDIKKTNLRKMKRRIKITTEIRNMAAESEMIMIIQDSNVSSSISAILAVVDTPLVSEFPSPTLYSNETVVLCCICAFVYNAVVCPNWKVAEKIKKHLKCMVYGVKKSTWLIESHVNIGVDV